MPRLARGVAPHPAPGALAATSGDPGRDRQRIRSSSSPCSRPARSPMPAADWWRGLARVRGTGARMSERRPACSRPGASPTTSSRPCASRMPTPTCCCRRGSRARPRLGRRGTRDRADLRHPADAGLLRPRHRPRGRAAGRPHRPAHPGRAAARQRTSCSRCGWRRTRPSTSRCRSRGRSVRVRRRASPTACCARSAGTPPTSGESGSSRDASNPDDELAAVHSHPVWVVRAFRRALEAEGRGDELDELLAADNTAPRVNLIALPGLAERAGRRAARPLLALRLHARRRATRCGSSRRHDGPRPRAGRGLAARRPRAQPRAARRSRASSGSTCAPARAARPRCSPRKPAPAVRP